MEDKNNSSINNDNKFALVSVPIWYGAGKQGTETAPHAFEEFRLAEKLWARGIKIVGWYQVNAEPIRETDSLSEKAKYEREIFFTQRSALRLLRGLLENGIIPIVLGGDHTVSIASLAAQALHLGGAPKVGVIWIDAHFDSHTPETTPSGNIHGMPLAISLGYGSEKLKSIDGQFDKKIYPKNVVHIGANSWEPLEMSFFTERRIPFFTKKEIDTEEGFKRMCAAVTNLSTKVKTIVVTIDADAFDKSIAPGVHLQNDDGILEEKAYALARHIKTCPNIGGIDIAEVVQSKDIEGKTIQFMFNFLSELLAP